MYVINNFSNQEYSKLTDIDILIWLISLMSYKKLGYTTKLYCEEKDIQFLKDNCLLHYYDEVDTNTFAQNKELSMINNKEFWFWRKIVAIEHEFNLGHEFFYSDTDVILMEKPDFSNCDLYVWWLEDRDSKLWELNRTVYCDWHDISCPKDYDMPNYIRNTGRDNFNCGLLHFKNQMIFNFWKKEMLGFIINNPCILYNKDLYSSRAVFACNTEQRFLKGIANHLKLTVKAFDNAITSNGMTPTGVHFWYWRNAWKNMEEAFRNNEALLSSPQNIGIVQTLLVMSDFVEIWMDKFSDNGLLLEWVRSANKEYIFQLMELSKNLKFLLTNYNKKG